MCANTCMHIYFLILKNPELLDFPLPIPLLPRNTVHMEWIFLSLWPGLNKMGSVLHNNGGGPLLF